MKTLLLLPVLLAAFTVPHGSDAAQPSSDAAQLSSDAAQLRGDNDWVIDNAHSSVVFRVKHAGISNFYGAFNEISGQITLDAKAPEQGSVSLSIPVESVDSRDAKRDEHLKGPDFFNGKENPTITFVSTKIGKKGDTLEVTGDLELAGKKKPVTMVVNKTGEGDFYGPRVGYEATFTIKRSDFGMDYGVAKKALGDEVTLMVGLELVKPKK